MNEEKREIVIVKHVFFTADGVDKVSFHIEVGETYVEDLTREELKELRKVIDAAWLDLQLSGAAITEKEVSHE